MILVAFVCMLRLLLKLMLKRVCCIAWSVWLMPRFLCMVLAYCISIFLFFNASTLNAQTQVQYEAEVVDGFGRLVLIFPREEGIPQYTVETGNGVLILKFEREVLVDTDKIILTLSQFISVGRRDRNGQTLRFALARGVRINTMEAGERLFIDFLPYNWVGLPPSLPQEIVNELARRAEEAVREAERAKKRAPEGKEKAKVGLRIGRSPTFTRLAFDWNQPFKVAVERNGAQLRLSFNHDAEINLSDLLADMPEDMQNIEIANMTDGLDIIMTIAENADIRAFEDGNSYLVDLIGSASDPNTNAEKTRQSLIEVMQPLGEPGKPNILTQGNKTRKPGKTKKTTDAAGEKIDNQQQVRQVSRPFDVTQGNFASSLQSLDMNQSKVSDTKPMAETKKLTRNPEHIEENSMQKEKFLRVEASRVGHSIRIRFPFERDTPSAVFERTGVIWLVFDTALPFDMRVVKNILGDYLKDIDVHQSTGGTIVRLVLADDQLTNVSTEGSAWVITIGNMVLEPTKPLSLERIQLGDGRNALKTILTRSGKMHVLDDPLSGDSIHVVTALGPPRGILKPHEFAQFSLLPSAHGLAIVPRVDDLKVNVEADDVMIGRERGLMISGLGDVLMDPDGAFPSPILPGFIDFRQWNTGGYAQFSKTRDTLQFQIASAEDKEKPSFRVNMAEFYLAHDLATEAMALIRLATVKQPQLIHDAKTAIVRGAAFMRGGHAQEALNALSGRSVVNNPHAAMWRAMAHADLGEWVAARKENTLADTVLGNYPANIRADVHLALAKADLATKNLAGANTHLSKVDDRLIGPDQLARLNLLQARFLEKMGRYEAALKRLDDVQKINYAPGAAEAVVFDTRIRIKQGLIDDKEAISRLESVAIYWRGDEVEVAAHDMLADLYVKHHNYRRAFENAKLAVFADSDSPVTRNIQERMNEVFVSLFLSGKADEMEPIDALSLYYDFKELTPIGRQGDEIVRQLADRLVALDLLAEAEELLEHQVGKRLKGAARAQVAADLAVIYLMDRKPQRALSILHQSRMAQLPRELQQQRRMVEARALAETGRTDLALTLLEPLKGKTIGRVRADIHWKAGNWRESAKVLEDMSDQRWQDSLPLTEVERLDILRAAIGYSIAEDEAGLSRLSRKYAKKMADSPHARAFQVVTQPIEARGVEFQEVVKSIAAIDSLAQFLDEYREQYLSGEFVSENS